MTRDNRSHGPYDRKSDRSILSIEVAEGNEVMEKRDRLGEIMHETAKGQIQGWLPSLLAGGCDVMQDIFRKSPLPESGTMGSVGVKASNG